MHAAHGLRYAHFSKCAGFTSFLECGSDPRLNLRVHAIVRDEELAAVGEQLAFGRVIERLDPVDLRGDARAGLLGEVAQLGLCAARTDDQDRRGKEGFLFTGRIGCLYLTI